MYSSIKKGFTLVELLIVVAIISLLAGLILVNYQEARGQSRDNNRKIMLSQLEIALRLYYEKFGVYPSGGCGASPLPTTKAWSGATTKIIFSFIDKPNCPDYIPGLAPEFIKELPIEKVEGNGFGYIYAVRNDYQAYKIAVTEVESNLVTADGQPFSRCPVNRSSCPSTTACGAAANSGNMWSNHYFVYSKGGECY